MTEKTKEATKKVAVVETTKKTDKLTKFDGFQSVEEMMALARVLIKTKLIPITLKEPEQVVAVVLQGKELGFDAITSLNNIHNIQGRATLGVHAIAALLKRKGIVYKLIEDAVFVREDGKIDKIKLPETIYVDRRTTIRFYEKFGKDTIENDISFTASEAKNQGLLDKSNWKRMLIIMLRARTLAIGARFVAPDALLGMYESSEWADAKDVDLELDEDGNVIR